MKKRDRVRRILFILAGGVGAYLGPCFFLASKYLSPNTPPVNPPSFVDPMKLDDGNPVWQTHGLTQEAPSSTVFVFAHGYGGGMNQWQPVMDDLRRMGYDSMEVSMPGHGGNPDSMVGFGPKEARILSDAVDRVRHDGAKRVVLVGVSMGGAAAWLATELNPRIDAIATEGAYARFDEAMKYVTDAGGGILAPMVWMAEKRSGVEPEKIVPLNAAKKWKKPALVLQAADDKIIPLQHAQDLAEASGAELEIIPNVSHACCYNKLGMDYARQLEALSKKCK